MELPKLPDLQDYITGDFVEIEVAKPTTKEEVEMIEHAYRNGVSSERSRILSILDSEADSGQINQALFAIKNKITEEREY